MTVIIPHPDDELKIIKNQNELILKLYKSTKYTFYKQFPLWIPINIPLELQDENQQQKISSPKETLKKTGKIITKVAIGKLQYENNQLYSEVTISTENEKSEYITKLLLLKKCEDKNTNDYTDDINNKINEITSKQDLAELDLMEEKQLKIFRIGIVHQLSNNTKAISDSVWCKLK